MIILFDLDGTLLDSHALHIGSFVKIFEEKTMPKRMKNKSKAEIKELIEQYMGMPVRAIFKQLFPKKSRDEIDKLNRKKWEYTLDGIQEVTEIENATKVLNELRKYKHKIALVTSSRSKFTNIMLQKFNWKVDVVVTANQVKKGKPNTEAYELVMKRLGKPDLVIGDSVNDEIPAKKLGLKFLRLGRDIKNLEEIFKYLD